MLCLSSGKLHTSVYGGLAALVGVTGRGPSLGADGTLVVNPPSLFIVVDNVLDFMRGSGRINVEGGAA
jgi:hypothetical protein